MAALLATVLLAATVLVLLLSGPARAEQAQLLTVIDGDSLLLENDGRSVKVRLIGIDAPEGRQEFGTQARTKVMNICYGRPLRLEFDVERRDRYGRMLAYVYCGDIMLNEEMVRSGLALAIAVKPNTAHYQRLKRAEEQARKTRSGFWAHGGLKMTPAQWRQTYGK
jgi:micrococcal nuclease